MKRSSFTGLRCELYSAHLPRPFTADMSALSQQFFIFSLTQFVRFLATLGSNSTALQR